MRFLELRFDSSILEHRAAILLVSNLLEESTNCFSITGLHAVDYHGVKTVASHPVG